MWQCLDIELKHLVALQAILHSKMFLSFPINILNLNAGNNLTCKIFHPEVICINFLLKQTKKNIATSTKKNARMFASVDWTLFFLFFKHWHTFKISDRFFLRIWNSFFSVGVLLSFFLRNKIWLAVVTAAPVPSQLS